ncbi:UDP-galactose transporter [Fistulina hepatica ATCC 64428]|uniref:UDP-galactose transporter homolog 1 n=1 Tax=Fistulina hepatica ATCC 64428 TaxID=1128425 RepID=A0A0D7ANF7_9AGAR|nr:UDP-galactose transporter [Fistulina hepatica ATCC 64428]
MPYLRLALCVLGVYSMFLLWGVAQERLSAPFKTIDGTSEAKFKSALFIGTCQSILSAISAYLYITFRKHPKDSISQCLGLEPAPISKDKVDHKTNGAANGTVNGSAIASSSYTRALLWKYFQCSVFITSAAPFGFASLSYISYPAMVLGKSCKLVPVLIMNVLLYRRRFASYKYVVVAMVTTGITMFMHYGGGSKHKSRADVPSDNPYANLIGITYLLINLAIDGATNSTQDEIFARFRGVTGQQMMFWINVFCTLISLALALLPLPYVPVIHESEGGKPELFNMLAFIRAHPGVISPLFQFSITGALGQLFIFETLQHFGSLTLVTITLTRKLFSMLLSVVLYNHRLTLGQWVGTAVVFAGISVEAIVKRRDVHAKRIAQEKEKPSIKTL